MSAPPLKPTVANCQAKNRYADEFAARAALMIYMEDMGIRLRVKLYVYRCKECGGWHWTRHHQGSANRVTRDDPGFKPTPKPVGGQRERDRT